MGKSAGAAPDVVDLLKQQHTEIRRAFRRAARPGPQRRQMFADLVRLLAVHEAAEEAHVHPVARKILPKGRAVIKSRLKEEKQAKKLLVDLERVGPDGASFAPKLRALRTAVLSHAKREEREEFPALRRYVTAPRRRSLALESKLTQAIAPTHPHPLVNSQIANKLGAPLLSPLDRARDLLRRLVS